MAFCGISRDKGWYGACFVPALCLFICEALDRILRHFFSNHHCGCLYLGCESSGAPETLEGVRERLNCLHCTTIITTNTPQASSIFFSSLRLLCGATDKPAVSTEVTAGNMNTIALVPVSLLIKQAARVFISAGEVSGRGAQTEVGHDTMRLDLNGLEFGNHLARGTPPTGCCFMQ